jgi:hypothetical protein
VSDAQMESEPVNDSVRIGGLLAQAQLAERVTVRAQTFLQEWNSFSHPVALSCDDGNVYVVKGRQIGHPVITEQVIALLGMALGAPVGEPILVDVPAELIAAEPALAFLQPGIAHGNLFHEGYSNRSEVEHHGELQNRTRFALLAVLYGWAKACDHQLIYRNMPPHLVLSVDHGHFLWGGTAWGEGILAAAPPATVDEIIASTCSLTVAELDTALERLARVLEAHIVAAVATPPDEWGITPSERVALVSYFSRRQQDLLLLKSLA